MHEFRRFIQEQLDARGWRQADLVRASGMSRSHVSKLMRDERAYLGQMPDSETIIGLARGFTLPEELVRTAASRALAGYSDEGQLLHVDLTQVSTDALLNEVRRRIESTGVGDEREVQEPRPEARGTELGRAGGAASSSGAPMKLDFLERLEPRELKSLRDALVHGGPEAQARLSAAIQAEALKMEDQGSGPDGTQDDYALAHRKGLTKERQRRLVETEPEDVPQADGPEFGA